VGKNSPTSEYLVLKSDCVSTFVNGTREPRLTTSSTVPNKINKASKNTLRRSPTSSRAHIVFAEELIIIALF
jgi:hypothetical protein